MSPIFSTKTARASLPIIASASLSVAACDTTDVTVKASSTTHSTPKPVAAIDSLTGNTRQIALDQGFADALTTLKLTSGTVGKAKLDQGALISPITGGNVTVFKPGTVSPYVIGQIQHEGSGLSRSAGDTKVELTNLNVDPSASRVYGDVTVNDVAAVSSAYLFKLDGRTLKPLQTSGGTETLEGTKVEISPVAAPLLNDTFKTDAVKPGFLVGIAKITISTAPGD